MYVPEHFRPASLDQIHDAIEAHPFAVLVTTVTPERAPAVTHLPLLLDRERGPRGTLVGHLARANPQSALLGLGHPTKAVFSGPQGYVSPSWYHREPSLPTWNYVAVHAAGTPRLKDDPAYLRGVLERTVDTFERSAGIDPPWRLRSDNASVAEYAPFIVAFELPLDALDAVFKLSQNMEQGLRRRVVRGLLERGGAADVDLARYMEARGSG